MKIIILLLTILSFINLSNLFSDELINEFNFSAKTNGLYNLNDGRKFEALKLDGHIKNNIGNFGNINCNSLIETKKEELIFLKVICEISLNDGNKIWSVLERDSENYKAGIGNSKIIDGTGKFQKLKGTNCIYAVTKYENSSFVVEKCKLTKGLLDKLKSEWNY